MSAFRSWRWSAVAITFSLIAPAAQAEMITPDSIPNPPAAVGSAGGTPVDASNLVGGQYAGLGLKINGAAITSLTNIPVWAPIGILVGQAGTIDYAQTVSGMLVSPGTSNPTTVSTLSVDIVGPSTPPFPLLSMHVYGQNGQTLNITPSVGHIANFQDWTFTGSGISSFSVGPSSSTGVAWGVADVSFTPATAPEPSSLILAGLGTLGLAARFGWRRARPVA